MQQVGIQLSPLKLYRAGNALIVTGLILSLGLILALASTGYVPYLIALPAAVLGVIAARILLAYPLLNLMIAILGFVLVASNEEGFQVIEIAYAAYLYAFLLTWFLRHAISESSDILTEKTDLALAVFLGLLPATLILTYFFRGDFLVAFSELVSLSMLLVYFPVKHAVVHHRIGPKLMLTTVVMMSVVVAITNSFEYASDLSNATHLSHISGSRVVVNDALLTIGSLMSLTLLVYARNPISLLLSASAVALTFAGLIMTQARGAWLAFMLGAFVLVLLVRTPERVKILTIGTIISVLILGIGYILIGPFLNVIIEGIAERFSTIATAFTQDLSLVNRFRETQAVLEKIIMNPLIGYGPGVSYVFYDIVHQSTDIDSFVHNGYVGLWYKYGLWGLGLVLYFWYSTVKLGLHAFRSDTADHWTRLAGLAGAIPLIALTITTLVGNPFFLKNQLFIIAIAAGLAVGAGERSSNRAVAPNSHT
ncbi:MAG: O-antigen ligase family protein [Rhodothermaceae bacterium]|nr:O-antigen ligase family protein [Rhodothermaceae bacterium]MXZ59052.1 O-antigen ligase family protein [Rhodothermaceae bacterium]MYB91222.1 O-antigen ligase family protein [Rhodothermaceae bacterium]MYD69002.1 O-antigen ligase family protein [Rhodothermaceae bacterium]MYG43949.1 O-antigen ligase family protein [Rhodothermaceae bacterium]